MHSYIQRLPICSLVVACGMAMSTDSKLCQDQLLLCYLFLSLIQTNTVNKLNDLLANNSVYVCIFYRVHVFSDIQTLYLEWDRP